MACRRMTGVVLAVALAVGTIPAAWAGSRMGIALLPPDAGDDHAGWQRHRRPGAPRHAARIGPAANRRPAGSANNHIHRAAGGALDPAGLVPPLKGGRRASESLPGWLL
jgi:hypothetical protein